MVFDGVYMSLQGNMKSDSDTLRLECLKAVGTSWISHSHGPDCYSHPPNPGDPGSVPDCTKILGPSGKTLRDTERYRTASAG